MRGLTHGYRTSRGWLGVLDDVTFVIPPGGFATLTGPSGAGKTTLLSVLGGLERVQTGEVSVGEHDLAHLGGDALAAFRRQVVGFVFQDFGLLEVLTARENVEVARALAGVPARQRRQEAGELLAAVGLSGRETHRPGQLSGGERQRVAIARALANGPQLVLADEPTGNLDGRASQMVLELLESLPKLAGVSVVVVTHNPAVAERAPIRLRIADGHLAIAAGTPPSRGGPP